MSKIKFDKKDFSGHGPVWSAVFKWADIEKGESSAVEAGEFDKAVQRLIKKYVKRERKRLARVMQDQQEIAIDGFLKNLAADWAVPVHRLTGSSATIGKEELIEILKQEQEKGMNWPADFPGKH